MSGLLPVDVLPRTMVLAAVALPEMPPPLQLAFVHLLAVMVTLLSVVVPLPR